MSFLCHLRVPRKSSDTPQNPGPKIPIFVPLVIPEFCVPSVSPPFQIPSERPKLPQNVSRKPSNVPETTQNPSNPLGFSPKPLRTPQIPSDFPQNHLGFSPKSPRISLKIASEVPKSPQGPFSPCPLKIPQNATKSPQTPPQFPHGLSPFPKSPQKTRNPLRTIPNFFRFSPNLLTIFSSSRMLRSPHGFYLPEFLPKSPHDP